MTRRVVAIAVALVVVVVAGLVVWRLGRPGSELERALAMTPADTERATWTDWAGVRRELGASLDASSSSEQLASFLDDAFAEDLSSMSALLSSADVLQQEVGFSPATLEWELFAQSSAGAVDLMRVTEEVDLDEVGDRLEALGWQRPEEDDGTWVGGPDVLSGVGTGLTPELQHLTLLADDDLIVSSDQIPYLEDAGAAVRGDAESADDLADLSAGLDDPLAAAVYAGPYACEKLAMAQADDDASAEADQLVERAGGVHPLTGFAMAERAGGDVRVVMQVEDQDDAASDADARAALAAGPAPGQGGSFTDRFTVEQAGSRGRTITMDLEPEEGEYVLSDLTSGPVLFATC